MDTIPISNNLKFHAVEYRRSMGKLYAFVTCLDVQSNGKVKGKGKKCYWGEVSTYHNAADILEVMKYGGKWDNVP